MGEEDLTLINGGTCRDLRIDNDNENSDFTKTGGFFYTLQIMSKNWIPGIWKFVYEIVGRNPVNKETITWLLPN